LKNDIFTRSRLNQLPFPRTIDHNSNIEVIHLTKFGYAIASYKSSLTLLIFNISKEKLHKLEFEYMGVSRKDEIISPCNMFLKFPLLFVAFKKRVFCYQLTREILKEYRALQKPLKHPITSICFDDCYLVILTKEDIYVWERKNLQMPEVIKRESQELFRILPALTQLSYPLLFLGTSKKLKVNILSIPSLIFFQGLEFRKKRSRVSVRAW